MFSFDALAPLPFLHGRPECTGDFKQVPEDFLVAEILGYDLPVAEQNEHLWLQLEKKGQNTTWLAQQLAKHFQRPLSDVSFAGLKDRQAVTQQWFSVRLAADEMLPSLSIPDVTLISSERCAKKLHRGALAGNAFTIRLRNVSDRLSLEQRFQNIADSGVPNYFGSQRFGHNANNLINAERWRNKQYRPKNKADKGFLLSAVRAWLFNLQAAKVCDTERGDVAEEGFLLGQMRFAPPEELSTLFQQHAPQIAWLEKQGCKMQKRALKLRPNNASITFCQNDAILKFDLPAGSYATSVLRELVLFSK